MKKIRVGALFSIFDQKLGPVALAWHPKSISKDLQHTLSMKSINIMRMEEREIPDCIAFLPLPSLQLHCAIYYFQKKSTDLNYTINILNFPKM